MPRLTLSSLLLSCFLPGERALEIEGDLLEERQHRSRIWHSTQVFKITCSMFRYAFMKAPWINIGLGLLTALASYLVTGFLLIPLMLKQFDMTIISLLFAYLVFRAFACFVVGVTFQQYAGKSALTGVVCGAFIMLFLMMLHIFALAQGFLRPGPNTLGVLQSVIFYMLCSVLPLLAGGMYGRRNQLHDQQHRQAILNSSHIMLVSK